uniref:Bm10766, isoform c n=1 Tax=Brugia malayi TaxID=6279 RepID=A0A0J9Y0T5_BRUMA|nr:Bm10766, isoform c [Brugia malayi]
MKRGTEDKEKKKPDRRVSVGQAAVAVAVAVAIAVGQKGQQLLRMTRKHRFLVSYLSTIRPIKMIYCIIPL